MNLLLFMNLCLLWTQLFEKSNQALLWLSEKRSVCLSTSSISSWETRCWWTKRLTKLTDHYYQLLQKKVINRVYTSQTAGIAHIFVIGMKLPLLQEDEDCKNECDTNTKITDLHSRVVRDEKIHQERLPLAFDPWEAGPNNLQLCTYCCCWRRRREKNWSTDLTVDWQQQEKKRKKQDDSGMDWKMYGQEGYCYCQYYYYCCSQSWHSIEDETKLGDDWGGCCC